MNALDVVRRNVEVGREPEKQLVRAVAAGLDHPANQTEIRLEEPRGLADADLEGDLQQIGPLADSRNADVQRQVADPKNTGQDEELIRKEKALVIRKAINDLPENQRLAVILRRYDHFSYAKIAETLGVSHKAVKSLLSRARVNLKHRLSGLVDS